MSGIDEDSVPEVCRSSIEDLFHREPVAKLCWVKDVVKQTYELASVAGDGRVLFWSLENKLQHPMSGARVAPSKSYFGHGTMNRFAVLGGSAMAFSQFEFGRYVVATEGGGVLKCVRHANRASHDLKDGSLVWKRDARNLLDAAPREGRSRTKRHIERYAHVQGEREVSASTVFRSSPEAKLIFPVASHWAFDPHFGAVCSVDFSPFHRNVFLSASADGDCRISHLSQRSQLTTLVVTSSATVTAAKWSRSRPLVIIVGDSSGQLSVFDLCQSHSDAVHVQAVHKADPAAITSLSFNSAHTSLVCVGDAAGRAAVVELQPILSKMRPSETAELERLVDLWCVPQMETVG